MNFLKLPSGSGKIFTSFTTAMKQHSPEILVYSGIGEILTGTFLACRASTKVGAIIDEFKAEMNRIEKLYSVVPDDPELKAKQEKEEKKAIRACYLHATGELAKLYGLSVGLMVGGTVSILCGAGILKKRNAAIAAAYTTLDNSYREYRKRVAEKYGEEAENDIRMGAKEEKIDVKETDENGKEKTVKQKVKVTGPELSGYARYFVYGESAAAEPNFDYNQMFLIGQQEVANRMLRARGYLFLNDVYEMLGFERTVAGQVVGWVYDRNSDNHGDNVIDLRIETVFRKRSECPGDYEKCLIIDPNVDGEIMNHAVKLGMIEK